MAVIGPRHVRRQEEIRRVAAGLFRHAGYSATSMETLAGALEVNKATLYHYFSSKAEILFDVVLEPIADAAAVVDQIPLADPPVQQFRALLGAQLSQLRRLSDAVAVYFHESPWFGRWLSADQVAVIRRYEHTFAGRFDLIIAQGQLDGQFRRTPIILTRQALVGMVGHTARWFRPDSSLVLPDLARGYADLILDGMRLTEGQGQPADTPRR